jgi:hypothetical protein
MARDVMLAELTGLANQQTTGRGGWPAERAADPSGLLVDVERLLTGAGLLRVFDSFWWLSPVMGRWETPPEPVLDSTEPAAAKGAESAESEAMLFRAEEDL